MRGILVFVLLVSVAWCAAQTTSLFINDNVDRRVWQDRFDLKDQDEHSSVRPYHRPVFLEDSAQTFLGLQWESGALSPLISLGAQADYTDSLGYASHAIAGLAWNQNFGKRLELDAAIYGGLADGRPFYPIGAASDEIHPGVGRYRDQNGRTGTLFEVDFSLRWQLSDIFQLEAGKARHFLGSGYRSLMLSDNTAAYPYLKLDTKVWQIRYTNLFSWMQGKYDLGQPEASFEDKFTSSHYFSWNISSRFNLHLFESIIWQGKDTLSDRGFDVNYLNPIIFYRPVEFAAGSADNAILGFGMDFKAYPTYLLYANVVLDEFLLSQLRARDGWWANKYGVQFGFKGFDVAGVEGLYVQAEVNIVRPFTYSHGSPLQNYTHLDQALAHPIGANFAEVMAIGAYTKGKWEVRDHLSYVMMGRDANAENLGGDIFRSYVNPFRNYGNSIGQGLRLAPVQNSLTLARVFHQASDARLSLTYHLYYDTGAVDQLSNTVELSFRCNFGDGYR